MHPKYEEDFYGWAMTNAQLMKEGKMNELDIENLIEEIESMGRSEKNQLGNRLGVLIAHLLKWQYQPEFRGKSWKFTIEYQRNDVRELILDNPSLKSKVLEIINKSYVRAKLLIQKETPIDLKLLPKDCPYTFDQCLDDEFYPE